MIVSDVTALVTWWFVFILIGILFLPLTTLIFSHFIDRGYIFSKILGMLFVSYMIFFLGTLQVLPFTHTTIVLALLLWGVLSLFVLVKVGPTRRSDLLKPWKLFIFEEVLFFMALTFWSYIRAHEPSIHGLEKFMDFGFVNSALRTEYFPVKDLWLSPQTINYYYFGHIVTAVLTKISALDAVITYNLMIATLFACTFTCAFSIGANLINQLKTQNSKLKITGQNLKVVIIGGLLCGFLVALAGNLHTIYSFFAAYDGENPVPFWQLALDFNLTDYWYPNATRFIPFTIHEFPIYSFVVSDLHGHVLSIPIVLTIIALLLSILVSQYLNIFKIILLSFLLAAAYMTNAWDGLIYAILTGLVFAYIAHRSKSYARYAKRYFFVVLASIFFTLPFSLFFKPFVSGIGVLCAPEFLTNVGKLGPFLFEAEHCQRSPLYQLIILHGFWYFWAISFVVFIIKKLNAKRLARQGASSAYTLNAADIFVLILIVISTLLLLLPEFIYAKDIYPGHYRANTMFKLGYEAFMMLGISTAYIIMRLITNYKLLITNLKIHKKLLLTLWICFGSTGLFLVMIYPYFAINSYYGGLKIYRGLNGLIYLRDLYSEDYEAILWIRDNIYGQPVILEGAGESYTDYARVSANTGLPTVVGWPVHEWLWRGTYDEAGKRVAEVEQAYTLADVAQTNAFLQKYNIAYVFVGALERQKYPTLNEEKFKTLGESIYQNGQTAVYKIK